MPAPGMQQNADMTNHDLTSGDPTSSDPTSGDLTNNDPANGAGFERFTIKQRITLMVNRYEVRSVNATPESKPAVIAQSQLAAFDIDEQRLVRLAPHHREYLQRYLR